MGTAEGAGGGGNGGVGVGDGPGDCGGGGGLGGGELGGGGGGEGDGGEGGGGGRWGQLQEARVGLERGAGPDEWPVLLVLGLEGSSAHSAKARNPFRRLRGLPPDHATSGAERHGFMATLQPWPMSLARSVPTVR